MIKKKVSLFLKLSNTNKNSIIKITFTMNKRFKKCTVFRFCNYLGFF